MKITVSIALTVLAISITDAAFPKEINSRMNHLADPCVDFYEYACGSTFLGWSTYPKMPASYRDVEIHNEKMFYDIIKKKHPVLHEMYDSCLRLEKNSMDLSQIPLKRDLDQIRTATTKERLLMLAGDFSRTGTNAFINLSVETDPNHPQIKTIIVRPAMSTLPEQVHQVHTNSIDNAYRKYIEILLGLSGYNHHGDNAADHVVLMEQQLASIHSAHEDNRREHLRISEVIAKWPLTFGSFSEGIKLFEKTTVEESFKIYVEHSEYLNVVEKMLENVHLDELKVYLAFLTIHSRAQWLSKPYYEAWFNLFGREINHEKQQPLRSKVCMDQLIQFLPDLFGKYFTDIAFDKERDTNVRTMISLIEESLVLQLHDSTLLDNDTKQKAQAKMDLLKPIIGQTYHSTPYPRLLKTNYPANVHAILSHTFDKRMKTVGKTMDRMESSHSAMIPIVKYIPEHNTLLLPTAILQPPFYSGIKAHPALNFGALGTLIGREMVHSIDFKGQEYDEHGNKETWWKLEDSVHYKTRGQCMVEQYAEFAVTGPSGTTIGHVNGEKTLIENFADNAGLSIAWDAYRKYMIDVKPKIKGIKIGEADQMFYLAFAQNWCSKSSAATLTRSIRKDDFSPPQWRVNGAIMNHPQFEATFQCSYPGLPMTPSKKCPTIVDIIH